MLFVLKTAAAAAEFFICKELFWLLPSFGLGACLDFCRWNFTQRPRPIDAAFQRGALSLKIYGCIERPCIGLQKQAQLNLTKVPTDFLKASLFHYALQVIALLKLLYQGFFTSSTTKHGFFMF